MNDDIGPRFMRETASRHTPSAQEQGLPQPPLELEYPVTAALIPLPAPGTIRTPALDVREAIERRMTLRRYQDAPIRLEELAFLLWATQGVKRVTDRPATLRTVPSAGARHAFETYLLINRVESLTPGLYRYIALEHALLQVQTSPGLDDAITADCYDQQMVKHCAVFFIWAAVAERMTWRYGQRGYRYLHLDAGHVCQNLYLAAEALDCGVCAVAAFNDAALNHTLGFDGEKIFTIYCASLGKKIPSA